MACSLESALRYTDECRNVDQGHKSNIVSTYINLVWLHGDMWTSNPPVLLTISGIAGEDIHYSAHQLQGQCETWLELTICRHWSEIMPFHALTSPYANRGRQQSTYGKLLPVPRTPLYTGNQNLVWDRTNVYEYMPLNRLSCMFI